MNFGWGIVGILITLIVTAVGDLVSEELRGRLDRIPDAVLRAAIRCLPAEIRQSVGDEWLAELHHILHRATGLPITRLVLGISYALGLRRTARRIGRQLRTIRTGTVPTSQKPAARWEPAARRAVDLMGALVALPVLAIPMLLVALAIRLGTPGPALYRQQRIGQGGRLFTMYKFRTMRLGGSDAQHLELIARELRGEDTSVDGSWKIDSDPRVTRLGSILRRTSADELPQLLNVLLGHMSLWK